MFEYREVDNQNQLINNLTQNEDDNNLILTKFVTDFACSRYSTLCLTDENEIFLWGKNIIDPQSH